MSGRSDLVRLGSIVADDLEHRGYQAAGVVRQLAQAVAAGAEAPEPGCCPECGDPVTQPERGRRRVYCSTRCRKAHHRGTEQGRNATVAP